MDEISDCVFRSFDKNRDARLEVDEFMAGCACLFLSKGDPKKNLEYLFDFYDVNHDGILSVDELKESYMTLYKTLGNESSNLISKELAQDTMRKMAGNNEFITKGSLYFY